MDVLSISVIEEDVCQSVWLLSSPWDQTLRPLCMTFAERTRCGLNPGGLEKCKTMFAEAMNTDVKASACQAT